MESRTFGNGKTEITTELRNKFLALSKLIRHRGPDWNGIYTNTGSKVIITHERLSAGLDNGSQPIKNESGSRILSVNGEIYNYKVLSELVGSNYKFTTNSDCEVVIPLIDSSLGEKGIQLSDGIFSFIYYNADDNKFIIVRDPIGVTPLYYGFTENNELMVASEMKSLHELCKDIDIFPPGHYMTNDFEMIQYYKPNWFNDINPEPTKTLEQYCKDINQSLTEAVEKTNV